MSEEALAAKRLQAVEDQLNYEPLLAGAMRMIDCPFCGHMNFEGEQLCCDPLRKAVIVVLTGRRAMKLARNAADPSLWGQA